MCLENTKLLLNAHSWTLAAQIVNWDDTKRDYEDSQSDNQDGCHQTNDHINTAYSIHKRPYHEADTKVFSPEIYFSFVTWNSLSCSSARDDTNSVNAHLGRVPVLPASLVKARRNRLNRHTVRAVKARLWNQLNHTRWVIPLSRRDTDMIFFSCDTWTISWWGRMLDPKI